MPGMTRLPIYKMMPAALEFIAQETGHTVVAGVGTRLEVVVDPQLEVLCSEFQTGLALIAHVIHGLGFRGGSAGSADEADIVFGLDVACGRHHCEIKRGLHIPAVIQIDVLAELHANG